MAAWLKSGRPQVFRLFGYAGTGKTTLARHFAEGLDGEVAFGAFTGKAAHVLRSKGCDDAATIHSLIYRPKSVEEEDPSFVINREAAASKADLIVIDECSMVDEELGPRPPVLRRAGAGAGRPGAASARQGRRLLHRRRARHDADRGAPAGARQPDHPHVDGGARGRAPRRSARMARAGSSAAPTSTPPPCCGPTRCWSA